MQHVRTHQFCLTEEEALGLLDLIMITDAELTLDQRTAVTKLAEYCRLFLRDEHPCVPASHPANAVAA